MITNWTTLWELESGKFVRAQRSLRYPQGQEEEAVLRNLNNALSGVTW